MKSSEEIARLAGVSQSTVSRVLNNIGNVKPETAERVWQVVKEVGYVPNALARNLARGRAGAIGLFFFHHQSVQIEMQGHGFHGLILQSCLSDSSMKGFMLTVDIVATQADFDRVSTAIRQRRVDGAIFFGSPPEGLNWSSFLQEGHPVVLVNGHRLSRRPAGLIQVTADNRAGAHSAAKHLISLGHRDIAVFTGSPGVASAGERLSGFREAMEAHGVWKPQLVIPCDYSERSAYQAMRSLLQGEWRERRPDAVFASTDAMAVGILAAGAETGLQTTRDLTVVGFDNLFANRFSFTTVQFPLREMCSVAVERLLKLIEGNQIRKWDIILPCPLVMR